MHIFHTNIAGCNKAGPWKTAANHNVICPWRRRPMLPPQVRRQRLVTGTVEEGQVMTKIMGELAIVELLGSFAGFHAGQIALEGCGLNRSVEGPNARSSRE